jgi:hypothetical protein
MREEIDTGPFWGNKVLEANISLVLVSGAVLGSCSDWWVRRGISEIRALQSERDISQNKVKGTSVSRHELGTGIGRLLGTFFQNSGGA